jgi:capsular exopolysaccharide synthesis family protein
VIQVTSPEPGDGRTTVALNLAAFVARSGKRTLLIDGDFRNPQLREIFAVAQGAGLDSWFAGSVEIQEVIRPTAVANLALAPTGAIAENAADLATSSRWKALLDLSRRQYDCVVVDSPSLLADAGARAIASKVAGVVVNGVRQSGSGRFWQGHGGYRCPCDRQYRGSRS